jgi:hypothetical protein
MILFKIFISSDVVQFELQTLNSLPQKIGHRSSFREKLLLANTSHLRIPVEGGGFYLIQQLYSVSAAQILHVEKWVNRNIKK